MKMEIEILRNCPIIKLSGDIESNDITDLQDAVEQYIDKGFKNFIIDCKNITFISSVDIGTFMTLYNRCRSINGNLKLSSATMFVRKILHRSSLDGIFPDYKNTIDAIKAFGSPQSKSKFNVKRNITADDFEPYQ